MFIINNYSFTFFGVLLTTDITNNWSIHIKETLFSTLYYTGIQFIHPERVHVPWGFPLGAALQQRCRTWLPEPSASISWAKARSVVSGVTADHVSAHQQCGQSAAHPSSVSCFLRFVFLQRFILSKQEFCRNNQFCIIITMDNFIVYLNITGSVVMNEVYLLF